MATKFQPIGGNILVKPETEKTTTSGIVIPDSVDKEKPQKGKVIALGTGRMNDKGEIIPFNVKVGDMVMFKKYSPDDLEMDGEDYLIMEESDILGVLK